MSLIYITVFTKLINKSQTCSAVKISVHHNTFIISITIRRYERPGHQQRLLQTFTEDVFIFTALHGMQTRSYYEIFVRLSVCPSVCLSVKRMHCDKTEERYV